MQNASEIKEKIISIIQNDGPSFPVRIASRLNLSPLFASAFLSELLSEKRLNISCLRVGNSPLYFIPGQESKLEPFSEHLKSKEKEAFLLLQKSKFLIDEVQQPAIRVAMRMIKDFAFAFEKNGKLYWRFFIIPESEFVVESDEKPIIIREEKKEVVQEEVVEEVKENVIKPIVKKTIKKSPVKKKNDKFFNQVKEFLSEKSIEILDIEGVSQGDLILRVSENDEEKLIVAYNKKRVGELEIIKAHKKATELGLTYTILSLGEPLKKLSGLIDAIKNLSSIEKL